MAVGTTALVAGGLGLAGSLMPKKRSMETSEQQTTGIPAWQRNYVDEAMKGAQKAYQTPIEQQMGYDTASGQMLTANPYLDAMAEKAGRGLTQQYSEQVLPGLQSSFASMGRFGSGLHAEKMRQSARDLQQSLADQRTQMYGQQYGQERGLQQAAQQRLDPLERARQYMGIVGQDVGSVSKSQLPVEKQSGLASALGMGASLLGGFSDKRLKENLKEVVKLENGLTVYVGNYKEETGLDMTPQLFLIAQEVQKVNPEAVFEENGFLKVDYTKAVK